jgi:hypothetical protein
MSRGNGAGNIHVVTADDPPFLFHRGEGYDRHRLPVGAEVIFPNRVLDPVPDRRAAIERAVDHPLDSEPLDALLRSGMKVTIALDDISLPLPPMATPDVRQTVLEVVLERLDRAGVTDVHLIVAICLHRRMTPGEIGRMVGGKIFRRFFPDRLYNHDAEDPEGNVHLGTTTTGEDVELSRRAVESDLLIYVNLNLVTMDGGHKSVPVGLATYRSVRHHHNAPTMLHDSSYMDPPHSAFHRSCERMGDVVARHLRIFTIETTLNGNLFADALAFLKKREHDWTVTDRISYSASRTLLRMLPYGLRRRAYNALPAPYGVTAVHAGGTDAVHRETLHSLDRQQEVEVEGQADVLLIGLPSIGPYNVHSILNPILVHCLAVGYFFNLYRDKPLVRRGGVMIIDHPIEERFHMVHHPSYFDMWHEVLSQTSDAVKIEKGWEESYARNERYIELYRRSFAYHGVHPFYMWYWGAHGRAHLGQIIAVRPESHVAARRLGYEIAPSMDHAIAMAREFLGEGAPRVRYLHCPPLIMTKVR